MGRLLMRVPLDFDWPMKQVWHGYLTPEQYDFPTCVTCDGTGYSREARAISDTFYAHKIAWPGEYDGARERGDALCWHDKLGQAEVDNLVAEHRLWEFWRHWDPVEHKWVDNDPPTPVLAADVNAVNAPGARGWGHDSINQHILVRFRCERLGIDLECATCQGHGHIATDEQRAEAENYEGPEPPEGEGFQLWENTSEGSPISPVFATLDELCEYAALNCSVFGGSMATADKWREMLDENFVVHEETMPDGTKAMWI